MVKKSNIFGMKYLERTTDVSGGVDCKAKRRMRNWEPSYTTIPNKNMQVVSDHDGISVIDDL